MREHLTFANVGVVVAMFLALGGGAYAFQLGRNSVHSRHIAPGAVHRSDVGAGAIGTAQLADGAVTNPKLASGAVGAAKLANGAVGSSKLDSALAARIGHARAWAGVLIRETSPGNMDYQPSLDPDRTYGFTAVARSGGTPGAYCLTVDSSVIPEPRKLPLIGTPDWNGSPAKSYVFEDSSNNECAANQYEVVTYANDGAGRSLVSFNVVVP